MHECEHAQRALDDALDGELSWLRRLRLRLHLWLCPGCRGVQRSLRRTVGLLRRCGRDDAPRALTQGVKDESEAP